MSDPWILKLVDGVEGIGRYPELAVLIGKYVTRYEPHRAPEGEQWLWVTDDPEQALAFDDPGKLHEFYSQSIGTRPWDGKPNRPITVFHVEISRLSHYTGVKA
jgi:hypothetical protein